MSIWGSPVITGGGNGVPLLTRAQWNALTDAQKQACGLVAIQDANSGFKRGVLAYGGDYVPSLLTASDYSLILAEALWSDYESGSTWGAVTLSGSGYSKTSASVRLPVGSMGSVSLPSSNVSVTAYAVINNYAPTYGDLMLLAVPYAINSGNLPAFFVRNGIIWKTVFSTDVSTGIASNAWHVLTLALDNGSKTCRYYIDGTAYSSLVYYNSGSFVSFSAATSGSVASLNADVAWVGVVSGAESESVILANHANIMEKLSPYFES